MENLLFYICEKLQYLEGKPKLKMNIEKAKLSVYTASEI